MPSTTRILAPGPDPRTFRGPDGSLHRPPNDWGCLPPGDAGLTRRVKALGPSWTVQEKKGRKMFSRGVWAPQSRIDKVKAALAVEREAPSYAHKQEAAARRRTKAQDEYVLAFAQEVFAFLDFHERHHPLAQQLAILVTVHATPVGSGTVARTERIPVAERAEAAVLAWMRHQTTAYDDMHIPRIKGARREVRQQLAQRSRQLLGAYRRGDDVDDTCPLTRAVAKLATTAVRAPPVIVNENRRSS